ncbi:MAG: cation-translocating P-type ATPase [Chloroflexi bacterium]|nr:cation-translocating P-type ATPase [Chloroflexota bacterium]
MASMVEWHHLPASEVLKELRLSDVDGGLTEEEASKRIEQYGYNQLKEQPRPTLLERLLNQLKDLVVILLIVASALSAILGEWVEAIAIILIVILNAALGIIQEGRAEEALAALKKLAAPDARVKRGGRIETIPAREVVPGDVVLLEAGGQVPADMRLLEGFNLQIEEASLTGESVPVHKNVKVELERDASLGDRKNMAYKSTAVTYGRGVGVAVATGMQTEIGKIAELIQSVEDEQTPLQRRLDDVGRFLVYAALIICSLVFLASFGRAALDLAQELELSSISAFIEAVTDNIAGVELRADLTDAGVEAFLVAVALAVAAVPEGLPAVVTVNLALGMREMVKRNALIRNLPAVETLGSASAICSDKTGTLTQNEMTTIRLYVPGRTVEVSGRGYAPIGEFSDELKTFDPTHDEMVNELLRGGALSSDATIDKLEEDGRSSYRIIGDPTEGALVVAAAKAGLHKAGLEKSWPRINELPFDSSRKRMSTLHKPQDSEGFVLYLKGAPDLVLDSCTHYVEDAAVKPMSEEERERFKEANTRMAEQALRVLAVARRNYEQAPDALSHEKDEVDLTFIGLFGIIDPARPEVAPSIERARQAGIKTVMVTGDYAATARAIAQEIGLMKDKDGRVVTGKELDSISDQELARAIDEVDVFARVSPEHKVRIVDAFRKRDFVVAMTGDGVNDAPALKRASIGVAMGITGTDVSKETADVVLTDDNYVSIVNAVEQGRIIYDNIRKFVAFLLTCNLAEIMVIFLATIFGAPSPLTAIQLLWLNLLTDGAPALALGVEKGDPDVMSRDPRPQNQPIIDEVMRINLIVQTIFKTAVTLIGFFSIYNPSLTGAAAEANLMEARSVAFTILAFSELLRAYSSRSEYYSMFKIGVFSNKWMQYAVSVSVVLLLVVIYVPFLNPIFDTTPLNLRDWAEIIPLMIVPTIAGEVTKLFINPPQTKSQPATAPVAGD